jgi:hypothetical protein
MIAKVMPKHESAGPNEDGVVLFADVYWPDAEGLASRFIRNQAKVIY